MSADDPRLLLLDWLADDANRRVNVATVAAMIRVGLDPVDGAPVPRDHVVVAHLEQMAEAGYDGPADRLLELLPLVGAAPFLSDPDAVDLWAAAVTPCPLPEATAQ